MSRRPYRPPEPERPGRRRRLGFVLIAAVVLGAGLVLAVADLLPRGETGPGDEAALPVQMSMAGYTPAEIRVRAGERVSIRLWTTDAAVHLVGGVHTFISDELGLYETVAAESSRVFAFRAPTRPGTYDFYCDTCCGGKASQAMHGRLIVEA